MSTVNIIDGSLHRNGVKIRPTIGDTKCIQALKDSQEAQKLPLVQGKHNNGPGGWKMSYAFSCAYCGKRFRGEHTDRIQAIAIHGALTKLFPARCQCGAIYEKHSSGYNATQSNQ